MLVNRCKRGENCKINPQLMNLKKLIGPLKALRICLSCAERHCAALFPFWYINKCVFGGSILLEELMAEHGSA